MACRRRTEDNITIHGVKPACATEEDRIAAETRANAALKKLVELLAKAAARDAIREAHAGDIEAALAGFQSVARLAGI